MTERRERMERRRGVGGPCPECGTRVRRGAMLCTWCFTWRPGRHAVRLPPAGTTDARTPRDRRTFIRTAALAAVVAGAGFALHDGRAARVTGADTAMAAPAPLVTLSRPPAATAQDSTPIRPDTAVRAPRTAR